MTQSPLARVTTLVQRSRPEPEAIRASVSEDSPCLLHRPHRPHRGIGAIRGKQGRYVGGRSTFDARTHRGIGRSAIRRMDGASMHASKVSVQLQWGLPTGSAAVNHHGAAPYSCSRDYP